MASIISIPFFHNIVYYPFPVSPYIKKRVTNKRIVTVARVGLLFST